MDDEKGIHKTVKKRKVLLFSQLEDAPQVAKLVSLPFPDEPKHRKRKRRGHRRKFGCVEVPKDRAEANENWPSQSSKSFNICPPLSMRGEEPNQHSRL
ncbi:9253_t:CDS:1, partial [Acaulospora colombiana]